MRCWLLNLLLNQTGLGNLQGCQKTWKPKKTWNLRNFEKKTGKT